MYECNGIIIGVKLRLLVVHLENHFTSIASTPSQTTVVAAVVMIGTQL